MKIICLASGGIDSSLLLFLLKKQKHDVIPLYVNYGHKSGKMEYASFTKICKHLKLKGISITIKDLKQIKSGLTDPTISAKDFPFFPARNLLLLTIGASYAFTKASRVVAISLLKDSVFPDQKKNFVSDVEKSLASALGIKIKILTPFIKMNKLEILKLAKKYHFPIKLAYSCHVGKRKPCGQCMACKSLKAAQDRINS